jgi:hypothetical protein
MGGLLGTGYSLNRASDDLARLRLNGLIVRVPDHHHRCTLTVDGIQFAIFYTKIHDRSYNPCSPPPPNPPCHPNYAPRCAPSTRQSTSDSPTPDCPRQPDPTNHLDRDPRQTHDKRQNPATKGSLACVDDPPDGHVQHPLAA